MNLKPQNSKKVFFKRNPTATRPDKLSTTTVLLRKHSELVGNAILDKLIEKFEKKAAAILMAEADSKPDADTLLSSIKQMVNLYLVNGFAFDGRASFLNNECSVTFTSPATFWSGKSLKTKNNSVLINDFALKTARAIVSRASVYYTNNQEITTFTVMQ